MSKHLTFPRMIAAALLAFAVIVGLSSCSDDAEVASENISKAADNFEVPRQIVFYNGITDKYVAEFEGYCSIDDEGRQLEVTCKDKSGYSKHFLGLSDNVTYFVLQADPVNVSTDHYRVTFKPESVVPDYNIQ